MLCVPIARNVIASPHYSYHCGEEDIATLDLSWSLTSHPCGWGLDTDQCSIVVRSETSPEIIMQSLQTQSTNAVLSELAKGNYTIEITATNACNEISTTQTINAVIECESKSLYLQTMHLFFVQELFIETQLQCQSS